MQYTGTQTSFRTLWDMSRICCGNWAILSLLKHSSKWLMFSSSYNEKQGSFPKHRSTATAITYNPQACPDHWCPIFITLTITGRCFTIHDCAHLLTNWITRFHVHTVVQFNDITSFAKFLRDKPNENLPHEQFARSPSEWRAKTFSLQDNVSCRPFWCGKALSIILLAAEMWLAFSHRLFRRTCLSCRERSLVQAVKHRSEGLQAKNIAN